MGRINEQAIENRTRSINKQAEQFYEKYRKHMDALSKSTLAKVRGGLTPMDVYSLGMQLNQFEDYKQMCEEQGNLNLLGRIPTVAFDVITAVHGASILPIIASVQPIEEERGIVYFKTVRSATTKGSQTAGNVLVDPRQDVVTPYGYSNNLIEDEVVAAGDGTATTFNFTLPAKPIRSETLKLRTSAGSFTAQDVGNGQIYGQGFYGTVNYITGAVALTFAAAPANGVEILASYQQNFELSEDIPQIDSYYDSKTIHARIYALKGTIGLIQSFGMRKRFGHVAEDELAKDLVQEINRELGGDLIRKIGGSAMGSTTWYKKPPTNISYFEHKQTFKDKLADAEAVLSGNAGRGTISTIVAGKNIAAIIQTLPGFVKLTDGNTLGAHVFGTLDGITVIRVLEQNLLDANQARLIWRGTTPFETCAVYAPFMPLTLTNTLPQAPNPLQSMRAAAVWAGVDAVVPQYATNFVVNPGQEP